MSMAGIFNEFVRKPGCELVAARVAPLVFLEVFITSDRDFHRHTSPVRRGASRPPKGLDRDGGNENHLKEKGHKPSQLYKLQTEIVA